MTEAQWRQADIPPERVVWRNMQIRPSSAKPEINEKSMQNNENVTVRRTSR